VSKNVLFKLTQVFNFLNYNVGCLDSLKLC